MKDEQLTLRLPGDLAREVERLARARGVPRSQVVREALAAYLAGAAEPQPGDAWRAVAPMVGSLALDPRATERDAIAAQVRKHNWRE